MKKMMLYVIFVFYNSVVYAGNYYDELEKRNYERTHQSYSYYITLEIEGADKKKIKGVRCATADKEEISSDDRCSLTISSKDRDITFYPVQENPFYKEGRIFFERAGFDSVNVRGDCVSSATLYPQQSTIIKARLPLSKMGEDYYAIFVAYKQKGHSTVAQKGKEYIDLYRNIKESRYTDIEPLLAEAEHVLKEEDERKKQAEKERIEAEMRAKEAEARAREVAEQEEARRNTPEYKRTVIAEELCQRYEELGQANQVLKLSKEVDAASGTVNLYERRQLGTAKVYLEKEIGRLKNEYKKLGGGEFSRKKQCE